MAESCTALITEAEYFGKYLYEKTNMVYFSPDALRRLQAEGKFCWSPYNFELVEPNGPEVARSSGYTS